MALEKLHQRFHAIPFTRGPNICGTPLGFCIYCGDRNKLSTEHVVPDGILGNLLLPRSSCQKCSNITNSFEKVIINNWFKDARVALKLHSTKKRKNYTRPSHLIYPKNSRNGQYKFDPSPYSFYSVLLVDYECSPGIITGETGNEGYVSISMPFVNAQNWQPDMSVYHGPLNWSLFNRFLHKIALSFAYNVVMPEFLQPFNRDFILNDGYRKFRWMKGSNKYDMRLFSNILHLLSIYFLDGYFRLSDNDDPQKMTLCVVECRFFCHLRSPTYEVVVGRIIQ